MNVMVKDMPRDSICHLFYLSQNAVVKASAPYVDPATGLTVFTECAHLARGSCCGCGCRLPASCRPPRCPPG